MFKTILEIFHYAGVNRNNNKSSTLSKIIDRAVNSIISNCKLMLSTKQRVLRGTAISAGTNYAEIL